MIFSYHRFRRLFVFLILCSSVGILGACQPTPEMTCPPVTLAPNLGTLTVKSTAEKSTKGTIIRASIESAGVSCLHTETETHITARFNLLFMRDAAIGRNDPLTISYFAAVPAYYPSEQARKIVPLTVTFPEGETRFSILDQEIKLILPVAESRAGSDIAIVAGFDTSPSQMERLWGNKAKPIERKPQTTVPRR